MFYIIFVSMFYPYWINVDTKINIKRKTTNSHDNQVDNKAEEELIKYLLTPDWPTSLGKFFDYTSNDVTGRWWKSFLADLWATKAKGRKKGCCRVI